MNRLIERMMQNRGYDVDFFQKIEECKHFLPTNIDMLCERLHHYHQTGERVVLLTDFDMDGISAGVVGFAGMAELGFNVALYLPDTGAYGFDDTDIDNIVSDYADVKAIVTADVGITAFNGVQHAKELGIEMLVTDHHSPAEVLPNASVLVDPVCDKGDDYFPGICGAHVLYLVLRYYAEHYSNDAFFMCQQIDRLRVFAGLGTISDSMPLYYENRPLVRDAVAICRLIYGDDNLSVLDLIDGCEIYRRAFAGLFVMLDTFKSANKLSDVNSIDETFFSYYVAPAFNSVKRMHAEIELAYNVFFGGLDVAKESMERILELTEERKQLVADAFSALLDDRAVQPYAPYVYITDAPAGVRGLLAQQIMSLTGEPVLVVGQSDNGVSYVGSGRCPMWFPFLDLTATLDYVHPAGHNPAFGVMIDDDEGCAALVSFIRDKLVSQKPSDDTLVVHPDFRISTVDETADTDIDMELFDDFLHEIDLYRPFGTGFPAPDVELEFRPKDAEWFYLGKDKNHIKAVLPGGLTLLCFNQASFFPGSIDASQFPEVTKVRGHLNLNEFAGATTVQFLGKLNDDMQQDSVVLDKLYGDVTGMPERVDISFVREQMNFGDDEEDCE